MGETPYHVDQFRDLARRRLPRFAFDFLDSAAGRGRGLAENRAALDRVRLALRVLGGSVSRSTAVELLGERQELPFAAAPVGLANLAWPGTEIGVANACRVAGIPFILSTASSTRIEVAAQAADGKLWFQLYVGRDAGIVEGLIARALGAGVTTLVITVDLPAPGKRLRDLRNGFSLPFRLTPAMLISLVAHPAWTIATIKAGAPSFGNLQSDRKDRVSSNSLAELMAAQSSARLDWDELKRLRDRWPHRLVVKGVLRAADAVQIFKLGADAIVVSNHGGRQLDAAVAPALVLPTIRNEVGKDACILMDGAISSGEDIVRALALGADFVLIGRPFPLSAAARGPSRGPRELIAMLSDEFERAMVCCGCSSAAEVRGAGLLSCSDQPAQIQ